METLSNIPNQGKGVPFSTPEGYFDSLPNRVMARIDAQQPLRGQRRVRLAPYLAFAAGLALLFGLPYMATRLTGRPEGSGTVAVAEGEYGSISYYDLDAYAEGQTAEAADMEQEDIVSYLQHENIAYLALAY